ncbi:MAG: nuclear transport factor 2 family protein, partial [Solirubrobacteraceae bacterium]
REALAARFFAAAREGDLDGLVELLAEDAVMYGDGGGKAAARPTPLQGGAKVARFVLGLMRLGARRDLRIEPAVVNGQPGAIARGPDGAAVGVLSLDFAGGRLRAIRSVVNPDKLGHV